MPALLRSLAPLVRALTAEGYRPKHGAWHQINRSHEAAGQHEVERKARADDAVEPRPIAAADGLLGAHCWLWIVLFSLSCCACV